MITWLRSRTLHQHLQKEGLAVPQNVLAALAEGLPITIPIKLLYADKLALEDWYPVRDQTDATRVDVLGIAASMAQKSNQLVHRALVKVARQEAIILREVESEPLGDGLVGSIGKAHFVLGDSAVIGDAQLHMGASVKVLSEKLRTQGQTVLYLAQRNPERLLATFGFSQTFDQGVVRAVSELMEFITVYVIGEDERVTLPRLPADVDSYEVSFGAVWQVIDKHLIVPSLQDLVRVHTVFRQVR